MKPHLLGAITACALTLVATYSQAALVGRLAATPGGTDYQAVYDTDLDITWLANANLAATEAFGVPRSQFEYPGQEDPGIGLTGRMEPDTAAGWLAAMNGGGYLGFNDWRVPVATQSDLTCSIQQGFSRGLNCTGNAMGHLFYEELGGTAGNPVLESGSSYLALFSNIGDLYWFDNGTGSGGGSITAGTVIDGSGRIDFSFEGGYQNASGGSVDSFLWVVRDGDVVVPLPAAVWLFGSGLLGLIGAAGRKKAT